MESTTWAFNGELQLHARESAPTPPGALPPPAPPSGEPYVNGGTGLLVVIWLLWSLTTIILICRAVATSIVVNRLRASDWLMVAAYVGSIEISSFSLPSPLLTLETGL